ncbi:MAG TPA: helix-turn-helix domain-containing protein [Gaiellaceae bacterium]|nr:helix-turn-helix domain-containing protein [Gaiellaceae bacterium]
MPKVSEEHLAARRAEILAGARRAFAAHGYEGATVAKLEEETGLSRGAIFNYFEDKLDLFMALAAEDDRRWLADFDETGIDGVLRRIAAEDPAWSRVYIEVVRRTTTDPEFAARLEQAEPQPEQRAAGRQIAELQKAGVLRDDVDRKAIASLVNLLAYGLMMFNVVGEHADIDAVLELVHRGIDAPK